MIDAFKGQERNIPSLCQIAINLTVQFFLVVDRENQRWIK